ncbi:hypothetical protein [Veronia nyctiphanis]|uniref:hypothetical protein n=1 Tax=Veronia nyctiphanis TaxID=1278244 RepID=UPI001F1D0EBE|nr:hypothetical protein [Veronia nyctiphanis]
MNVSAALQWPASRPWWCILIAILFVVAASLGAKNLYFRGDYKVFFKDDNPQLVAYENEKVSFNSSDGLIIVVVPPDGQVFSASSLGLIREITKKSWQIPFTTRVTQLQTISTLP